MGGSAICFTSADVDRANADWLCTCGPAALAAICGLTLDEAKPLFMPAFPGYTTPTRMLAALRRSGRKWSSAGVPRESKTTWPLYGIARIQWHGPWTTRGADARWAYTHTHWVGVSQGEGSRGQHLVDVWDVNCVGECPAVNLLDNDGWIPLQFWDADIVPMLTKDIKRASGGWSITHAIEVERPCSASTR